jgi:hypothetical protein
MHLRRELLPREQPLVLLRAQGHSDQQQELPLRRGRARPAQHRLARPLPAQLLAA